jgi:hypothetical protein
MERNAKRVESIFRIALSEQIAVSSLWRWSARRRRGPH